MEKLAYPLVAFSNKISKQCAVICILYIFWQMDK